MKARFKNKIFTGKLAEILIKKGLAKPAREKKAATKEVEAKPKVAESKTKK